MRSWEWISKGNKALSASHDNEHCAEHRGSTAVLAGRGPGQPKYVHPEEHGAKVMEAYRQGDCEVSLARPLPHTYRTRCRVRTQDSRVAPACSVRADWWDRQRESRVNF